MARKGGAPENLKRYPKGQTGNPKGRKPDPPLLKEMLYEILNSPDSHYKTTLEALIQKQIEVAKKGNSKAFAEILDRAFGKAHQSISANVRSEVIVIDMENVDNADQG